MEIVPTDVSGPVQAIASVAALILSFVAFVKSTKTERYSRRVLSISQKADSLREIIREIENTKMKNLGRPDNNDAERAQIVASKTQAYEAIFKTYGQSLLPATADEIAELLRQIEGHSKAALQAQGVGETFREYIKCMAAFVIKMEKIPHEELEKAAAELNRVLL